MSSEKPKQLHNFTFILSIMFSALVYLGVCHPSFAQSSPDISEQDDSISDQEGFIGDLQREVAEIREIIANPDSSTAERVELAQQELSELEAALEQARTDLKRMRNKSPDTKQLKVKFDSKITAVDKETDNDESAKLADPCSLAKKFKRPKTTLYSFPDKNLVETLARSYLDKLVETEEALVSHWVYCDPSFHFYGRDQQQALAKIWSEHEAMLVSRLLKLEDQFVLAWAGDYTMEEEKAYDESGSEYYRIQKLRRDEEDLYARYRKLWDAARQLVDHAKYGPDVTVRFEIFNAQNQADSARKKYEEVARLRASLENEGNKGFKSIIQQRRARGLASIKQRVPVSNFRIHAKSEFIDGRSDENSIQSYLTGSEGLRIFQQEAARRHRYVGVRDLSSR